MKQKIDKIINNVVTGCGIVTYKQKFNKKYGFNKNDSHSINEISKLTKYKKEGLETIFNKGVGAYHTNPQSVRPQVHSPEQWAMARVYASINPSSKASKVDKSHLIIGGMINFHKIHWGTFTKQFKNRKNRKIKNLIEYAKYILNNPNEFNKITKKRANFYKHVIHGGMIRRGIGETKEENDENIIADAQDAISYYFTNVLPESHDIYRMRFSGNNRRNEVKEELEDLEDEIPEQEESVHTILDKVINEVEQGSIINKPSEDLKEKKEIIPEEKNDNDEEGRIKNILEKVENIQSNFYNIPEENLEPLPSNIFNAGTIMLKAMSLSDKISEKFLLNYYQNLGEDINSKKIKEEIKKKIAKPGNTFEFTSCGKNNKLFSKICNVGSNDIVLSDFKIEEIFNKCIEILKEFFSEDDISSLKAGGEKFPQDLIDLLNLIVNERKDYNKDFLIVYNEEIKKMKAEYLRVGSQFKKFKHFKKWYYKNYKYEGIDIQLSKFNEPNLDEWNSKWCNSKEEIEKALKSNAPLYETKINSERKIVNWKKVLSIKEKLLEKAKQKIESEEILNKGETCEIVKETFRDTMNELIEEEFFNKSQEYDFIITSGCRDGIVNYDYTNDKKINKHILEVYKLVPFQGSTTKYAVSIPITEFKPVQSIVRDSEYIAKEILSKQFTTKKENVGESKNIRIGEYKEFVKNFIEKNESGGGGGGTSKQIERRNERLKQAKLDLIELNKGNYIDDAPRRQFYKNEYKK